MDSGIIIKLKDILDYEIDVDGNVVTSLDNMGTILVSGALFINSERNERVKQLNELKVEIARLFFNFSFGSKFQ